MVDLDPQANATSGVGLSKSDDKKNIYRILLGETEAGGCLKETDFENLSVITSHPDLTGAEVEMVNFMGREYRLRDALAPVRSRFSYILIDCPPSLNILVINALAAADKLILQIGRAHV